MGSYYYLMAQLPSLIYDQKPPMSSEAFLALARSALDKEDVSFLELVSVDPDVNIETDAPSTGCAFIDNWREWERTLRLNLARNRALKLKRDAAAGSAAASIEPPAFPADAAAAASKIVNDLFAGDSILSGGSPLSAEIALDTARWNAIETLAGFEYFTRETVFAYLLKLKLMERRQLFDKEKGFDEYKTLYEQIADSKEQMRNEK